MLSILLLQIIIIINIPELDTEFEAVDGILVEAELDAGDAIDRPIPCIRAHVHTHTSMHARTHARAHTHARTNKHPPLLQDPRQPGGRQRRTREGGGGRYLICQQQ
jgi:hypothetical protein